MADTYLARFLANAGVDATPLAGVDTAGLAFAAALDAVAAVDPAITASIAQELDDQRRHVKLIASENFASPAVLLAMGNWLSDKYAEGAPGHRFYAGCENVDAVEQRAADVAQKLFGIDYAYVQPHSGIDANLVAFWAILSQRVERPALERLGAKDLQALSDEDWETLRRDLGNQKMMGMALDAGGHLTHGYRPNISGKLFQRCSYTVDPGTGLIDYDQVRAQAHAERPLILVAGYSSYPRKINFRIFREIADEVGATFMVDMAHFAGLVAGKVFTGDFDPVPHAHVTTTTTHKTLRGPRGGMVLCQQELVEFVERGCPLVLGGPLPHVMAAKAIALDEASSPDFADYAARVVANASALADGLMKRGAVVATDGTDNHLCLLDVRPYGLTGRQAESALRDASITVNRNALPNDPNGAWYTSGVRLGTPATTTLGMGVDEMDELADVIHTTLRATEPSNTSKGEPSLAKYVLPDAAADGARSRAADLLSAFPLYPALAF
ncbi:MAG: glycine hydroxymethyltransferase [Acidimicrobiaceae bacterium]|jgi:glycine hydroxymethyltransferase|nr:glycine hydroxymethyltransferase [Acidimicrobiaceae bacterium]